MHFYAAARAPDKGTCESYLEKIKGLNARAGQKGWAENFRHPPRDVGNIRYPRQRRLGPGHVQHIRDDERHDHRGGEQHVSSVFFFRH